MKYTSIAVLAALFASVDAKPLSQLKSQTLAQEEEEEIGSSEASRTGFSYKREPVYAEPEPEYTLPEYTPEPVYVPEPEPVYVPEPEPKYVPTKYSKRYAAPAPCTSCGLSACDCANLHTSLGEAIANGDQTNEVLYKQDGVANISYQQAGANSHQGAINEAYPDILKKTNQVENGDKKSNTKASEDYSGKRTKTFTINGSITIDETQTGGLTQSTNECESETGAKEAESLTRLADAEALVDSVCSQSGEPTGCDCGVCAPVAPAKPTSYYRAEKPAYKKPVSKPVYKKPAVPSYVKDYDLGDYGLGEECELCDGMESYATKGTTSARPKPEEEEEE